MSLKADIEKDFGSFKLSLNVEAEDETLALLGASGCGKSLSLKCIAGIIKPDRGHIELNGRTLFDSEKRINLSPQERRVGLMFQNYALFPNMTVLQNIRAGAKREKDKGRREKDIERIMESFGLQELAGRLPSQLSGGQQQRVALARILVSQPEILLLDEPFSALDSHLRFKLEGEVRRVIKEFGKTVILVSHDRDEVFRLSDKIAVMNNGLVETRGTREQVFADPCTCTAAKLTGCKNITPIKRLGPTEAEAVDWGISLNIPDEKPDAGYAGIRMHDIAIGQGENSGTFIIEDELENPFSYTLIVKPETAMDSSGIYVELSKELRHSIKGDRVQLSLPKEKILLLRK